MVKKHFRTDDGKIVSLDLDRFVSAEIERPSKYTFFDSTPVVVIYREVDNSYGGGSRINIITEHPESLTSDIYEALQEHRGEAESPHRSEEVVGEKEE